MSSGTIFLILALISLSGLGICHKVADFRGCRPSAVSVTMFGAAAAVLWTYTLINTLGMNVSLFPPFTGRAVAVAVLCGACAGVAILTFQVGVRYGRISTSWLVINLSTIIPAMLSLVIYQEWKAGVKWQQVAGLVLVLASVVFLWRDKAVESLRAAAKAGHESSAREPGSSGLPKSTLAQAGLAGSTADAKSDLAATIQEGV